MTIECPRCLLTNPDTAPVCECGFDLTIQLRKQALPSAGTVRRQERQERFPPMTRPGFAVGLILVWGLLTAGEWVRIRPELTSRKPLDLIKDSILLSLTDMAGALIIGALAWIVVRIIIAYEGRQLRPCPKRTTLGVTVVAAALLFFSRWISPDILVQHVMQAVVLLGIAVFSYYAGSRGWLGKW